MDLDSDNQDDSWIQFAKMTAKSLLHLEKNRPSEASVMFLTAVEDLLDAVHSCPPGMVNAHLCVPKPKEHCPNGVGEKIAAIEPEFSVDDSSIVMGAPKEVRDATLNTIQEAWAYMARSLELWKQYLSEIEEERDKTNLIGAFKISFMGVCHLRTFGLWHGYTTRGPKPLPEDERLDPWVLFSNFPKLNETISRSAPLAAFDHFNQFGKWPDEGDY